MTVYQQISKNKRRTIVLMMIFIAFILGLGYVLAEYYAGVGYIGLVYAAILSLVMTTVSYFGGDKAALLTSGAKEIAKDDNPYVWRMVENLCITSGLPMPRVYIINDPVMNAFATGRKPEKSSIALTTGLIENLENEELEGVIAHELSHIQNYDTRLMMVVVVLVGVLALMADWMWRFHFFSGNRRGGGRRGGGGFQIELIFAIVGVALIILSPVIAELIKLAISRKREYLADASAVLMTRYSEGLAGALEKIAKQDGKMLRANHATAHLYIANPFGAKAKKWLTRLWSTHPPIEDRIAKLRDMGGSPQIEV